MSDLLNLNLCFLFGSEKHVYLSNVCIRIYRYLFHSRPDDGDSDNEEISVVEQNKKSTGKQEYGDRGGFRAGKDGGELSFSQLVFSLFTSISENVMF